MKEKYRVCEVINEHSEGLTKNHGHFGELKEAQEYCLYHFKRKRNNSTFFIHYKCHEGVLHEQVYGEFNI